MDTNNADVPVAVGFGISTPDAAARAAALADGVVVGSALVGAAEGARRERQPEEEAVARLAGALASACRRDPGAKKLRA